MSMQLQVPAAIVQAIRLPEERMVQNPLVELAPDNNHLTPAIKHLFWWVPEKEIASLSPDAIVESVLSNGNEDTVRQLFDYYGIEKVAEIFNRQTSGRRINYRPRTVHFFKQYFHRHA
jgi:hypothetical protein